MPLTRPDIWDRLSVFDFDTPPPRPKRLARSPEIAASFTAYLRNHLRLLPENAPKLEGEYRAFLYLLATDRQVSVPSHLLWATMKAHLEWQPDQLKTLTGKSPAEVMAAYSALDTPKKISERQSDTLARFRKEFDRRPDPAFWSDIDADTQFRRFNVVLALSAAGTVAVLMATYQTGSPSTGLWVLAVLMISIFAPGAVRYSPKVYVGEAQDYEPIGAEF